MKAKVIKNFRDKNTKKLHRAGGEITISEERYEEINSTSLGVFVEEIKEQTDSKANKEPEQKTDKDSKEAAKAIRKTKTEAKITTKK